VAFMRKTAGVRVYSTELKISLDWLNQQSLRT